MLNPTVSQSLSDSEGNALALACQRTSSIRESPPPVVPDRESYDHFYRIGKDLENLWNGTRSPAALEESIHIYKKAASLCPPSPTTDPTTGRDSILFRLTCALSKRYQAQGNAEDLQETVALLRETLEMRPVGTARRASPLNNLAAALNERYRRLGDLSDLEESVRLYAEALELRPVGNAIRADALNNLAAALSDRYSHLGEMTDLEGAIHLEVEALSLLPVGMPYRAHFLFNLAISLRKRYTRLGEMKDLEGSIRLDEEALDLVPMGSPSRAYSLSNLACALNHRYGRLGELTDLERSIRLVDEALSYRPEGNPNRVYSLYNFALSLRSRYLRLGEIDDLEACIRLHEESLDLRPVGNPDRADTLINLAAALGDRYSRCGHERDLADAISHLKSGSKVVFPSQADALRCVLRWIGLAEEHRHESLGEAYLTAMVNLRQYLSIGPTVKLQYEALLRQTDVPSLPVDAAAYFIEKGDVELAIELLDEGRGLLVSEMRRFRGTLDLTDQDENNKSLSERYLGLCERLRRLSNAEVSFETFTTHAKSNEGATTSSVAYGQLLKEKREKLKEHQDLVAEIRTLPGCENFLSRPKFDSLRTAAQKGPIIIFNSSRRRSDVIVVYASQDPLLIPLADDFRDEMTRAHALHLEGLTNMAIRTCDSDKQMRVFSAKLKRVAKILWDNSMKKVVQKLEEAGVSKGSRIWLCPTSILTTLPLHAAGSDDDFLVDYFIPSYTPTLSALIEARRSANVTVNTLSPPRILVIAQTKSSGLSFAKQEAAKMAGLRPFVDLLDEEAATPETVITELASYNWAHFICHGTVSKNPFDSALVLHGHSRLSLSDIIEAHLPDAKFAFLAACHTAELALGETLHDEVLHLAAAMQFSGFRSVVGTMWQMEDKDGPRLAEVFYTDMLAGDENDAERHTRAASALWTVVQRMRAKSLPMARWANYVHIGA